jgi:3-oxoadipate enol-lactonase/4-carboxymuconolactone decarboxylase
LFTPDQLARDEPAVRYARSTMTPAVTDTLVRAFRLIAPYDLGDRLHGFASPAHFVAAGRDHVGEPADMQRAAGTVVGARFDVEPDAGHLLPLERPERVAELILTR